MTLCYILIKKITRACISDKQCISPLQKTLEETPNVTKEDSSNTPCVKEMKHSKQQTNCKPVSENKTRSGYVQYIYVIARFSEKKI